MQASSGSTLVDCRRQKCEASLESVVIAAVRHHSLFGVPRHGPGLAMEHPKAFLDLVFGGLDNQLWVGTASGHQPGDCNFSKPIQPAAA